MPPPHCTLPLPNQARCRRFRRQLALGASPHETLVFSGVRFTQTPGSDSPARRHPTKASFARAAQSVSRRADTPQASAPGSFGACNRPKTLGRERQQPLPDLSHLGRLTDNREEHRSRRGRAELRCSAPAGRNRPPTAPLCARRATLAYCDARAPDRPNMVDVRVAGRVPTGVSDRLDFVFPRRAALAGQRRGQLYARPCRPLTQQHDAHQPRGLPGCRVSRLCGRNRRWGAPERFPSGWTTQWKMTHPWGARPLDVEQLLGTGGGGEDRPLGGDESVRPHSPLTLLAFGGQVLTLEKSAGMARACLRQGNMLAQRRAC